MRCLFVIKKSKGNNVLIARRYNLEINIDLSTNQILECVAWNTGSTFLYRKSEVTIYLNRRSSPQFNEIVFQCALENWTQV